MKRPAPTCRIVASRLPDVDGVDDLGAILAGHVSTCLRCQAEAAGYRSLRRRLGELAGVTYTVPGALTSDVMSRIADPSSTSPLVRRRRLVPSRAAVAAATAAAAVATAGTVAVWLRRLPGPA